MGEKDKILIVEDERSIVRFLELELIHEGYEVSVAYDGEEGLSMGMDKYDCIILDLMLPQKNGIEVCRELRENGVVTPIIMLTARDALEDVVKGLDSGANDYVIKPFAIEELLARIRASVRQYRLSQNSEQASEVLQVEDLILDHRQHLVSRGGVKLDLTPKEYDLLYYLMKNRDRVLTREHILKEIWGYDFIGETNTVDVYIRHLRVKVDEPFAKKLIQTIRGVGYVLRCERDAD